MKPKVILFTATSADRKTTGFDADLGIFYSLAGKWNEDASLVGCDTLLAAPDAVPEDGGAETPRAEPAAADTRPILVVPDSRGRLKSWHYWREQPYWKDFVSLCSERTPREHLERKGVRALVAGPDRVDLGRGLEALNEEYGIAVVRVDSGGKLNRVLLDAGLVDELHVLVHPAAVGEKSEIPLRFVDSKMAAPGIVLLSYLAPE